MRSKGVRRDTRKKFKKNYDEKGYVKTTTVLQQYKRGDYVDIVVDSAIHKGMPHSTFHGTTGQVYVVFKGSVGVILTKVIGNRKMIRRVVVRIEHVRPSNCRAQVIARDEAKAAGRPVEKMLPEGPRKAFTVSLENNTPVEVKPLPHHEVF